MTNIPPPPSPSRSERLRDQATYDIVSGGDPAAVLSDFQNELGFSRHFSREKRSLTTEVRVAAEQELIDRVNRGSSDPIVALGGLRQVVGWRRHVPSSDTRDRFTQARDTAEEAAFNTAVGNISSSPDDEGATQAYRNFSRVVGPGRIFNSERDRRVKRAYRRTENRILNSTMDVIRFGWFTEPMVALDGLKEFMGIRRHMPKSHTRNRFKQTRSAAEESVFNGAMDELQNPTSTMYPMNIANHVTTALGHRQHTTSRGREMKSEVYAQIEPALHGLYNRVDMSSGTPQTPSPAMRLKISRDYEKVTGGVFKSLRPSQVAKRGHRYQLNSASQALTADARTQTAKARSLREGRRRIPTKQGGPTAAGRNAAYNKAYERQFGGPNTEPARKKRKP